MAYLGKLSPTVGNGLGGLPERHNDSISDSGMVQDISMNVYGLMSHAETYVSPPNMEGKYTDGMWFSIDGMKLFLTNNYNVYGYSLSSPYAINSATLDYTFTNTTYSWGDLNFSDDGLYLYLIEGKTKRIHQFSLNSSYELSTINATETAVSPTIPEVHSSSFAFSKDGLYLYLTQYSSGSLIQYALTTPFDIETISKKGQIGLRFFGFNSRLMGVRRINGSNKFMVLADDTASSSSSYTNIAIASFGTDNLISTLKTEMIYGIVLGSIDNEGRAITLNANNTSVFFYGSGTRQPLRFDIKSGE